MFKAVMIEEKTQGASVLRRVGTMAALLGLLSLGACSSLSPMEQRLLTGAAVGTAVGAAGTALLGGCVACGAAIGGVVGTGTGYVIDQIQK